jgi:hypothetical protein
LIWKDLAYKKSKFYEIGSKVEVMTVTNTLPYYSIGFKKFYLTTLGANGIKTSIYN